jgi:hypothetical protein
LTFLIKEKRNLLMRFSDFFMNNFKKLCNKY